MQDSVHAAAVNWKDGLAAGKIDRVDLWKCVVGISHFDVG